MILGEPTPEFSLPDLEGRIHRLDDYRGRILILNFWSADCQVCTRVDSRLFSLLPAWGEQVRLVTLAANLNEPMALLHQVAIERGLVPILLAGGSGLMEEYSVQTTPHLFVLDAEGRLCYQGAFDDVTYRSRCASRYYIQEAITALLAGRRPTVMSANPYGCALVRHLT
jgi:hypothetical protein